MQYQNLREMVSERQSGYGEHDSVLPKSKTWADQVEEEEAEDWGNEEVGQSADFGDQESEDADLRSVGTPTMPKNGSTSLLRLKSRLNSKSPTFVPTNSTGGITIVQNAVTPTKVGQQQVDTSNHAISLEDKILLDTLVSSKPLNSLIPCHAFSTGQKIRGKNKNAHFKASTIKPNAMVVKRHEPLGMVAQRLANQQLEANLRVDIYEEGEEEELFNYSRADEARSGDLSPTHSRKNNKTHTRKTCWDDKVNEGVTLKILPMREAKQKRAAKTTSTRTTRSKKK